MIAIYHTMLVVAVWSFVVAPVSSAAPASYTKDQYRGFAMSHVGDAGRGKALFANA